jgi:hypothetical protein
VTDDEELAVLRRGLDQLAGLVASHPEQRLLPNSAGT